MYNDKIQELRKKIDDINIKLLTLLNERAKVGSLIGIEKRRLGYPMYDPIREEEILNYLLGMNQGPFGSATIKHLFKEIFKATLNLELEEEASSLKVASIKKEPIKVKQETIGTGSKTFIFGPCSIESEEQLEKTACFLNNLGLKYIRGGAFKPRTSPYEFQGLGEKALRIMRKIADKYALISVVEVTDKEELYLALDYVDIIQIGSRNMHNYSLLKAAGKVNKPILLKRGFQATVEEFKYSAEYIVSGGNNQVILCERGIRTFERATRNTLDISSVPILKKETALPVIVDISHAAGRKDILTSLAKAALASGSDGIMAEVHPNPQVALSDSYQQMDFVEFTRFYEKIKEYACKCF